MDAHLRNGARKAADALPDAAGAPGPNTCTDMQVAEHKP